MLGTSFFPWALPAFSSMFSDHVYTTVILKRPTFGELVSQILPAITDPHLVPSLVQGARATGQDEDTQKLLTTEWAFYLDRTSKVSFPPLPHSR